MKRLAIAATLVAALSLPAFAGEVPTVGVVTPPPPPTTQTQTASASVATTIFLTLVSLIGR